MYTLSSGARSPRHPTPRPHSICIPTPRTPCGPALPGAGTAPVPVLIPDGGGDQAQAPPRRVKLLRIRHPRLRAHRSLPVPGYRLAQVACVSAPPREVGHGAVGRLRGSHFEWRQPSLGLGGCRGCGAERTVLAPPKPTTYVPSAAGPAPRHGRLPPPSG